MKHSQVYSTHLVPILGTGKDIATVSNYVDRFELYEQIKSGTFEPETVAFQKKWEQAIRDGFKSTPKKGYQNEKLARFKSTCFSGSDVARDAKPMPFHTGILTVDVDRNTPAELTALFDKIKLGQVPFVEAAARSISGFVTGAMWVNVRVEMPEKLHRIPASITRSLGLEKMPFADALTELHKCYGDAIKEIFERQLGILIEPSYRKKKRNLTHDGEIVVNSLANDFNLKMLAKWLESREQEFKERGEPMDITAKDAFDFAEKYAQKTTPDAPKNDALHSKEKKQNEILPIGENLFTQKIESVFKKTGWLNQSLPVGTSPAAIASELLQSGFVFISDNAARAYLRDFLGRKAHAAATIASPHAAAIIERWKHFLGKEPSPPQLAKLCELADIHGVAKVRYHINLVSISGNASKCNAAGVVESINKGGRPC